MRCKPGTFILVGLAVMDPVVEEELALLVRVQEALATTPPRMRASEDEILGEMDRLREQLLSGGGAEDQAAFLAEYDRQSALLGQLRGAKAPPPVAPDSPYFGHLRLREDGRQWDICLGKTTFIQGGVSIVDWRNAPISKIYYRYRQGEEFEEEIAGRTRSGAVAARRTVTIRDRRLLRVDAPEGGFRPDATGPDGWRRDAVEPPRFDKAADASVRDNPVGETSGRRFGDGGGGPARRADKHLPDIAGLIDPAQFELITRQSSGLVVIRGTAGSGKTTVALHRIAYLAYDDAQVDSARTLVVVFSPALRDYVAHVLPGLGISHVRVRTFADWASDLRRRLYPMLPSAIRDDAPAVVQRLKQHPMMLAALEAQVRSTPGAPTPRRAIDDYISALCRSDLLQDTMARVSPKAFSPSEIERACDWIRSQWSELEAWLDGDPDAEASLAPEDDALLLRAWQLRMGPIRDQGRRLRYRHIAVDEVQDFSPLEIRVLLDCLDERSSMTLAGDTQQHVLQDAGFASWSDFFRYLGLHNTEVDTLRISYRSSREIVRVANSVLGPLREDELPQTTRSGPPVESFRFTDHGACVGFLAEVLTQLAMDDPLASVALLTPSESLSELYDQALRDAEVPNVHRVRDYSFTFAPGIEITEVAQVKGLEFDYVVLIEASAAHYPETAAARRLLHVGATRAVHQLWLTSVATLSPLLRDALVDCGSAPI